MVCSIGATFRLYSLKKQAHSNERISCNLLIKKIISKIRFSSFIKIYEANGYHIRYHLEALKFGKFAKA